MSTAFQSTGLAASVGIKAVRKSRLLLPAGGGADGQGVRSGGSDDQCAVAGPDLSVLAQLRHGPLGKFPSGLCS